MRIEGTFLKSVLPDVIFAGDRDPVFGRFAIDSRLVTPRATFVACRGAQVDGHDFINDAVARGATGIIMMKKRRDIVESLPRDILNKISIALVDSPEETLIVLAAAWRSQFSIPLVGVTGSLGKTSTKEMIAAMARAAGKSCLMSEGNYNTLVGAALTLLQLKPEHQCAVVEMGISEPGEMARLAALVKPTMGVITLVAHQHMDALGQIADIAAEKRQIFKFFKPDNIGFVNGDQPILSAISYSHPVVKFGYKTTNQIQARRVTFGSASISAFFKIYRERYAVELQTAHQGRLLHALASAGPACFLGVPNECIVDVIHQFNAVPGRFEQLNLRSGQGIIINDAYNANPESVREALVAFERLEVSGTKVAVLGDMLGLGAYSSFWHRQVGRFLRKAPSVSHVVLVGEHMAAAQKTVPLSVQTVLVPSWREVTVALEHIGLNNELALLVKGSHGVGLENLVKQLV
ncbi:MAG: UDP-N-acetylmuramoyl-tripeptide--D-alanyl-D-alanine ligase [Candidatus Babeliaceae bacterium]|nr:UDP-N-acetylmuramoyl-tripeptide--D-alanyl-D-alanine ligase [Candidatus Babeliaceae bacterium]